MTGCMVGPLHVALEPFPTAFTNDNHRETGNLFWLYGTIPLFPLLNRPALVICEGKVKMVRLRGYLPFLVYFLDFN